MEVLDKALTKKNAIIGKVDKSGDFNVPVAYANVDLRNKIDGLLDIAKKQNHRNKQRLDIDRMPPRHFLLFFNDRKDRYVLLAPSVYSKDGRVVRWIYVYEHSKYGRITREDIELMPKKLSGKGVSISFPDNTAKQLYELLRLRRIRQVKELTK